MSVRICNFPKPDGSPCGSPALHRKKLCFYHHRDQLRFNYLARILRCNDPLRPSAPLPRDLRDVQATLFEVITALADNRIHDRRAGKLLYALQLRSASLRKAPS
jgi:hypothetical protein